jgi:hypothetical protein
VRFTAFITVTNSLSQAELEGTTVVASPIDPATGDIIGAPVPEVEEAALDATTMYWKYDRGFYHFDIIGAGAGGTATEPYVDLNSGDQFLQVALSAADTDGDGLLDSDEDINGNGTVDFGETDPNLVDTDGDGIVDGSGGVVRVVDYPAGVDTDGDGFVEGELDFGNDPTVADFADGNIAPYPVPDTNLNAADYLVATRIVSGALQLTPQEKQQALGHIDLNTNGQLDPGDLVLLLQAIYIAP